MIIKLIFDKGYDMDERRVFNRLEKEYHIEYGPFSSITGIDQLRSSVLKNLSSGGILFCADETQEIGSHVFLKIYIKGWKNNNGTMEKAQDEVSEMVLKVVAEVLHADADEKNNCFWIGAKFLGQVH